MTDVLLSVRNLYTQFNTYKGVVKALNGVSFDVRRGEAVGLVGETGCGKSVTALSILQLIDEPGKIVGGEVWFDDQDLLTLQKSEMRHIRGNRIAMIFQDPSTFLNPVFTIGEQLAEIITFHQGISGDVRRERVLEALRLVRMPDPDRVAGQYPHQLSGGMRQRCLVAMALACQPALIIADEPTTALDVTIQAAILQLLADLRRETGGSLLMITHNLGVVAQICDRVVVMYAGDVVEVAPVDRLFANPAHPYTVALLQAIPKLYGEQNGDLPSIAGSVPDLIDPPPACRFHPRCPEVMDVCRREKPALREIEPGHLVACHLWN